MVIITIVYLAFSCAALCIHRCWFWGPFGPRAYETRWNIEIELQQATCLAERSMGRIENYCAGENGRLRDSGKTIWKQSTNHAQPHQEPHTPTALPLAPRSTKFESPHLITLTNIKSDLTEHNLSKVPRTLRAAGVNCPQGVPESQPRPERDKTSRSSRKEIKQNSRWEGKQ